MNDKFKASLDRMETRLATMNDKNEELRQGLETRAAGRETLQAAHVALRRQQEAELTAFDAATEQMKQRRREVKEDYGELHELLGQAKQFIGASAEPKA